MATLTGQQPKDTYKDLLQVSNSNAGIDSTLRTIEDGEGTSGPFQMSTSAFHVVGTFTSGVDIISDTNSQDSLGSTGVRWLKLWTDAVTCGGLIEGATGTYSSTLGVTGLLTTTAGITSGSNIISDAHNTDSLGSTSVRWANTWSVTVTGTTFKPGTMVLAAGSITDTSGAISFGNENLTTTGTLAAGATTVTGLLTAGDITLTETDPEILGGDTTGALKISASTAANLGGNIWLYGNAHANTGDILFRNDGTEVGRFDADGGDWNFAANTITTTGGISGGALSGSTGTLTGLLTAGDLTLGGTDPEVLGGQTTGSLFLSAGVSQISGANIILTGPGHTNTGDIYLRDGSGNSLVYDKSTAKWDFQANAISTTGIVSGTTGTFTNVGGTLSTASQTNITGVGTITTGVWTGTDVAVAAGGTGASDAATARGNLGVVQWAKHGTVHGPISSGTSLEWTSIPEGVTQIKIVVVDHSSSGTNNLIMQLGASSTYETTNYSSTVRDNAGSTTGATSSFQLNKSTAAIDVISGDICLTNVTGNMWLVSTGTLIEYSGTSYEVAGDKSLAAALDQVKIYFDGSDTFDGGGYYALYYQ